MRRRQFFLTTVLAAGLCVLAAVPGPGTAAEPSRAPTLPAPTLPGLSFLSPAQGAKVEGLLVVGDRQVPLPRGSWQVTGHSLAPATNAKGEPYGAAETVILTQRQDTTVSAMAVVTLNAVEVDHGWDFDAECRRSDLLFTQALRRGSDGTCLRVHHVVTSSSIAAPQAWLYTLETTETDYLSLPGTWVVAGVTAANRRNLLDVRLYFNPESQGLPPSSKLSWVENDWHRRTYDHNPARKAFVESVTAWGRWYRHYVEAGLLGRLTPSDPLPLPWDNIGVSIAPEAQQRLFKLRLLRDAGVLSPSEFRRQSDLVAASAEKIENPSESWWTSPLAKALSYRTLALVDTGVIGYFVTGNATVSGAIAIAETVTKTGLYFGHEKLWDSIRSATSGGPTPTPDVLVGTADDRDADSLLTRWQKVLIAHLPGNGTRAGDGGKGGGGLSQQTAQAPESGTARVLGWFASSTPGERGGNAWWPPQWPDLEWQITPAGWLLLPRSEKPAAAPPVSRQAAR